VHAPRHGGQAEQAHLRDAGAAKPLSGWKLHPLKGNLKGFWSLAVTGNWRLIFRYDEDMNTAGDIDLIDYH
jgi:plasmid maintenance system killer protein